MSFSRVLVFKGDRMAWIAALYWSFCFLLTHMPPTSVVAPIPHLDKVVHFFLYLGLGLLVPRGFEWTSARRTRWIWFLVLVGYGLFDETTQPYFRRTFEWLDLLADTVGIALGLLILNRLRPVARP